jgi:hypothetical protein
VEHRIGAAARPAPGCLARVEGEGDGQLPDRDGDDEQVVRETFNDIELQGEDGRLVIFRDNDANLWVQEEHVQSVEEVDESA